MADEARFSHWAILVVGDAPLDVDLTPDPAAIGSVAAAPTVTRELTPGAAALNSSAFVVGAGAPPTQEPAVLSLVAPDVTVFVGEPPPPEPPPCSHETEPAYLAMLQAGLLPRGFAWTREPDAVLTRLLAGGLAHELACLDSRASMLLRESDPRTTLDLLPDWERAAGLPSPCTGPLETIGERRDALVAQLNSRGGASPAYFEGVLDQLGYPDARVLEFRPFVAGGSVAGDRLTSPQRPFRAGSARAGDRLTNNERWLYTWAIESPNVTVRYFLAGSGAAGEPLAKWGNGLLECTIRRLAPAHTFVLFQYPHVLRPGPASLTLSAPASTLT